MEQVLVSSVQEFLSLLRSGLRRQRSAGSNRGPQEHLHRDAVLDGSGGHRLRREPRRHVRLQGNDGRLRAGCVLGSERRD